MQLRTHGDAELELWAANRHVEPFERSAGEPVRFEVAGPEDEDRLPHAEQTHNASRVSRKAVRRRGNRRVGKDDTARAAGEVA